VAALRGSAFARPTCQLVPPTVSGYRPYCPYTAAPDASGDWKAPNLAKARALIRASGTRGQTVVVWAHPAFRPETRYIVSLLRTLGYRARSQYDPDYDHYAATADKTPGFQAGFSYWAGIGTAADVLGTVGCHFQQNPAHFCNPRIDAQVARLKRQESTDPAGSAAFAATIDREITKHAPWVPLLTPSFANVTSARVGNYQNNTTDVLLDQLWVR
jgi:peptide/nickel transport system substrate-binding protein